MYPLLSSCESVGCSAPGVIPRTQGCALLIAVSNLDAAELAIAGSRHRVGAAGDNDTPQGPHL